MTAALIIQGGANAQGSFRYVSRTVQEKKSKEQVLPAREEVKRSYDLPAGALVEVSNIHGSVTIETVAGSTAQISVVRTAARSEDLASHRLIVAPTQKGLEVRDEPEKQTQAGTTPGDRFREQVILSLPRRVDLKIAGVTDGLNIGEVDGDVRINGVNGAVEIAGAATISEIKSVVGDVRASVRGVDKRGMTVGTIVGGVELVFTERVDADLSVHSVTGGIFPRLPHLVTEDYPNPATLRGRIGGGGPPITISTVVGSVKLRSR